MQIDGNSIFASNNDVRLRGSTPVRIFQSAYINLRYWVFGPFEKHHFKVVQCIGRLIAALFLMAAMTLVAIPALIGRCIQLAHYNRLKKQEIGIHTKFKSYMGISLEGLPLKRIALSKDQRLYHWTKSSKAIVNSSIKIFSKKLSMRGDGFYLSESKTNASSFGCCRFAVSLELQPKEICEVSESSNFATSNWYNWESNQEKIFLKVNSGRSIYDFKTAIRQLFLLNGFKAQRYNYCSDHAICAYDEKCADPQKVSRKKKNINSYSNHTNSCVSESHYTVDKEDNKKEWKVKKPKNTNNNGKKWVEKKLK